MTKNEMRNLVKNGYNKGSYHEYYRKNRDLNNLEKSYFDKLLGLIHDNSQILDLGCGSGIPFDLYLADNNHHVTGIDISEKQIRLAEKLVPQCSYIVGDYSCINLNQKYDAVISLYSLFHIPKEEHEGIIRKIYSILKQNGVLIITMGVYNTEEIEVENDFCGKIKMAWSNYDAETNINIIKHTGFKIIKSDNEIDYGSSEEHMWILAGKE